MLCALLEFFLCLDEELVLCLDEEFVLKMIVVHVPGAFTLPNEESIICTNWLGLDEAHVNENHNAFPDDLPVDSTTVAFKLNLIDNCLRNFLFSAIKDCFPKHA